MKQTIQNKRRYIVTSLILLLVIAGIFVFVSPGNVYIIAALIGTITLFFASTFIIFFSGKRSMLFSAGIGLFFAISALIGFDIVQTILLLLVIIGIDRLIQ